MYQGNVSRNIDGRGMQSGQEYSSPTYRIPTPGQTATHGQLAQGPNVQKFQSARYSGSTSQTQYGVPQPSGYSNTAHTYRYSHNIMGGVGTGNLASRFSGPGSNILNNSSTMYPSIHSVDHGTSGSGGPGFSSGIRSNVPMHQYQPKVADDRNMMQYRQENLSAPGMYDGSQLRSTSISTVQPSPRPTEPSGHSTHFGPAQNAVNYMGGGGSSQNTPSYSQQLQYQKNMGTVSANAPATSSLYMQQGFNNQQHSNYASSQTGSSIHAAQLVPGQYQDSQVRIQHQNAFRQQPAAVKQGYVSQSSNVSHLDHAPQHVIMGTTPGSSQQTVPSRYNSPMRPVRGQAPSRPNMPMPPHTQQRGSMSPMPRLQSYSSTHHVGGHFVNQVTPNRPNLTLRTTGTTSHSDQAMHGFGVSNIMNSPPVSQEPRLISHVQGPRMYAPATAYSARYPHGLWQGTRAQPPAAQSAIVSSTLPHQPRILSNAQHLQQSQELPARYRPPSTVTTSNQLGYHQPSSTSATVTPHPNSILSTNSSTVPSLSNQKEFESGFNLERFLSDSMEGSGSFLQQLEEVTPTPGPPNNSSIQPPPASSNFTSQTLIPTNIRETATSDAIISSVTSHNPPYQKDLPALTISSSRNVDKLEHGVGKTSSLSVQNTSKAAECFEHGVPAEKTSHGVELTSFEQVNTSARVKTEILTTSNVQTGITLGTGVEGIAVSNPATVTMTSTAVTTEPISKSSDATIAVTALTSTAASLSTQPPASVFTFSTGTSTVPSFVTSRQTTSDSLHQQGMIGHHGMIRHQISGEPRPLYQMPSRMALPARAALTNGPPRPESMHLRDGGMVRGPGSSHYLYTQQGYQRYPPPHPSYGYRPHHQTVRGPYPTASAQPLHAGPYIQHGSPVPTRPHGYIGQNPPYSHQIHPRNHHLQQQLQGLRQEAQQLQTQLRQAQFKESNTDTSLPMERLPRSEQIRSRLLDVDGRIGQIMSQLYPPHPISQTIQDPYHARTSHVAPHSFPHVGESSKSMEDSATSGKKKKQARKPKPGKNLKKDGKEGKKPPKKKKRKESDGDPTYEEENKNKKKTKKQIAMEINEEFGEDSLLLGEGDLSNDTYVTLSPPEVSEAADPTYIMEDGEIPLDVMENPRRANMGEKRKKMPPATLVKAKKKRKRGYDSSDEMNFIDQLQETPPLSPEDSLIEKRRSGRNVKRKRYIESIELSFSGDEDDSMMQVEFKKNDQLVQMNDVAEEDVMIVDKILSHRVRRRRSRQKSENNDESHKTTKDIDISKIVSPSSELTTDLGQAGITPENTVLSPTSLKNPRIRRLSLGVDHVPEEDDEGEGEDEYFLKYKNYSYLHCDWKTKDQVEDKRFDQKLKRYIAKHTSLEGKLIYPELEVDELFNPDFVEVDRVLDVANNDEDENGEVSRMFLIKWCSLAYEDSTWEREEAIEKTKIEEFEARCKYRPPAKMLRPHKNTWKRLNEGNTVFCNNNVLRDYQFEGINWLLFNWYNRRNCILADEMGLGKTIQSITFLQKIFDHGIHGPFLIVAPLSTIANWQREFASWTTINAVVYHGSQTSRDMIQTYEWFCRDENLNEIVGMYKIHAVITTYEMVILDSPHLLDVDWRCLIIDEAHRLKNLSCKLVESLSSMELEHKVLLTGTPLQNNVEELFALLAFLQPETFDCKDSFSLEFGNLKDNTQVEKLQGLLKPMMLRRLKEDVEKSLAPKQETIIEVELTNIQKKYYRAILERNFEFLSKGASGGNVPNLMNTMMELRKCCNHPYLIKGAEDKIMLEERDSSNTTLQAMIQSSGKLVLIDKLLPRLKEGGHKVLIFSQMVRVLDILEDYLVQRGHLYERIDGCIRGNERQMAIDRFSRKGYNRFVFLLCTRAGGLGINLTAADTVIIFDSDWNPQNDLQAQARCHRIGQQKSVKIYRLITRNSYEREMFDKASLKLGLDKAVLQSISGRQDQVTNQTSQPQLSKHEVEDLLKRGAYGAIMDDNDAASKFCEEDIDQILDRRAHTVTLESGEKGSTFSKASFVSAEDRPDISLDDPNFWEKWAKKADLTLDNLTDNKLILEIPRNRKQTRRFGGNSDDQELFAEIGSGSDDSAEYDSDGNEGRGRKSKSRSRAGGSGGGHRKGWGRRDCFRIEKFLLTFGWGRWTVIQKRGSFSSVVDVAELEQMARTVLMYCLKYYAGDEKIKLFVWDLITPASHAKEIDLRNHEGLTAPILRGRKGKRAKEDTDKIQDEQSRREWARDIDLNVLLPDDGFKRHIQHQCNKILLRIRLLYYLRTEILRNVTQAIDDDLEFNSIDLEIVDKLTENPTSWWDEQCDKCLFIGIYKHGYEKYNLIRADPKLCFLGKAGPPDDRALAAEMDVEPEDADGDPEYKPTRVTFAEMEFLQDSPAPSTPNAAPTSPTTTETISKKKVPSAKHDLKEADLKKKVSGKDWPSASELNSRLRRLVTSFQKHYKHMQQRLMNIGRRSGRSRCQDTNRVEVRKPALQARWTRREEMDFYRTVSTFGIERSIDTGDFIWTRFRNNARLDRKTDENLRNYYLAFRDMCEQVCQWKDDPGMSDETGLGINEEIPNIEIAHITEEKASKALSRVRLFDKMRCNVLNNPNLKEGLSLCQRSFELPIWWRCGLHDRELLIVLDRYGMTKTEINALNDPEFTFFKSMQEYEADPVSFQKRFFEEEKMEMENTNESMKSERGTREDDLMEKDDSKEEEKMSVDVKMEEVKLKDEMKSEVDETNKVSPDDSEEKVFREVSQKSIVNDTSTLNEKDEKSDLKQSVDNKDVIANADEKELEQVKECDVQEEKMKEVKLESNDLEDNAKYPENTGSNDETVNIADEVPAPVESVETEKKVVLDETEGCLKRDSIKSELKDEDKVVQTCKSAEKVEEHETLASSVTTSDEGTKGALQMSLRSKTIPTISDSNKRSTYSGLNPMSCYTVQSMSGRWPKDRVLIQRVEQVCYCVINGKWPKPHQSLFSSLSSASSNQSGSCTPGSSQTSAPQSEEHRMELFSSKLLPSDKLTQGNSFNANEQQMKFVFNEVLALMKSNQKTQSHSSTRRGRRRRRNERSAPGSSSSGGPFNNHLVPSMDISMQRKIEQLIAENSASLQPSSLLSRFIQGEKFKTSKESSANESGSTKPRLSTLLNSASRDEKLKESENDIETKSCRNSGRLAKFRRRHSVSSQSKSKEFPKRDVDSMKSWQEDVAVTSDQRFAMFPPLQQIVQDAITSGMDPTNFVTTFLSLCPNFDQFKLLNSSKPQNLPLPPQSPMEKTRKLLERFGLPPELVNMPEFFFANNVPTSSKSEKSDFKEHEEGHEKCSVDVGTVLGKKYDTSLRNGGDKVDALFHRRKDRKGSSCSKKSRKSTIVSPATFPPTAHIPVHNTAKDIRLSGNDAPLNKELAEWLSDNSGYTVDYQALRQQLNEPKQNAFDVLTSNKQGSTGHADGHPLPMAKEAQPEDLFDEETIKVKTPKKHSGSKDDLEGGLKKSHHTQRPLKQDPIALPDSTSVSSKASSIVSKQQMNEAAGLGISTADAITNLSPEILAHLSPDAAMILATHLVGNSTGGISPDFAQKSTTLQDINHPKSSSPPPSSTESALSSKAPSSTHSSSTVSADSAFSGLPAGATSMIPKLMTDPMQLMAAGLQHPLFLDAAATNPSSHGSAHSSSRDGSTNDKGSNNKKMTAIEGIPNSDHAKTSTSEEEKRQKSRKHSSSPTSTHKACGSSRSRSSSESEGHPMDLSAITTSNDDVKDVKEDEDKE